MRVLRMVYKIEMGKVWFEFEMMQSKMGAVSTKRKYIINGMEYFMLNNNDIYDS